MCKRLREMEILAALSDKKTREGNREGGGREREGWERVNKGGREREKRERNESLAMAQ